MVPGKALLDAGHADQDHAELAAVVVVAELFQGCGPEPVGLVDDEQFDERRQGVGGRAGARVERVWGADDGERRT
jgi:hypothetical protein